ncbi:MAG: metal ABC transporter substrate-binding protein [Phycisphaerae bacterium]|nr:metal ABC transporter substrate-binding protein [Phycisphaerae bacterium]
MQNTNLIRILIFSIAIGCILTGCKDTAADRVQPEIAVTNSYLHCVVNDLCNCQKNVFCLTPPGMCPGHFDISPGQVNKLCECRLLLRFDFQQGIDGSLSRMKDKGLKIAPVPALPGLCVPETYLAACRKVCGILSSEYPQERAEYELRLKQIEKRLENLTNELSAKIKQASMERAGVLASVHQLHFCNWLGLETIAEFAGSDIETISNINDCIQKSKGRNVRFVIANKQEGTALADALAERLGAKVVVFSNFPNAAGDKNGFDDLLRANVLALLETAGK